MLIRYSCLLASLFVLFAGRLHAQSDGRWRVALTSSYFGDQARPSHLTTTIRHLPAVGHGPISFGLQWQFFLRSDLALQYVAESLHGKTERLPGDELNVQSALSLVAYPLEFWRLRPFFQQGILWKWHRNAEAPDSKSRIYYEFGIGTELTLSRNWFSSLGAKLYSDGLNYHGWSTTFSFGYRL